MHSVFWVVKFMTMMATLTVIKMNNCVLVTDMETTFPEAWT